MQDQNIPVVKPLEDELEENQDKEYFFFHALADDGLCASFTPVKIGVKKARDLKKGVIIMRVTDPVVFYEHSLKALRDSFEEVDEAIFNGSLINIMNTLYDLSETLNMKIVIPESAIFD